jgi:hypothetical protein
MIQKQANPAAGGDRARNTYLAALDNRENSDPHAKTQDFRSIWLARRFHLSISTASTVADLAFLQREVAR